MMPHYFKDKAFVVASLFLLVQTAIYYSIAVKEDVPVIVPWNGFARNINQWQTARDLPIDAESLANLQPDDYLHRNYIWAEKGVAVNFLVAYFSTRRTGHAPHSPQWCLPGSGWKDVSSRPVQLSIPYEATPIAVNEYIVEKGPEKQVVVYWYHQGTRVVANELVAQLYALPEMLLHGRTDTALVRVIVPVKADSIDSARANALEFARDVFPFVKKQIR
jgi:EpsI family protein